MSSHFVLGGHFRKQSSMKSRDYCPWCGERVKYFSDDDNRNYSEYICENYNAGRGKTCWWRESSGVPRVTYEEALVIRSKSDAARRAAKSEIENGISKLRDIEHGKW